MQFNSIGFKLNDPMNLSSDVVSSSLTTTDRDRVNKNEPLRRLYKSKNKVVKDEDEDKPSLPPLFKSKKRVVGAEYDLPLISETRIIKEEISPQNSSQKIIILLDNKRLLLEQFPSINQNQQRPKKSPTKRTTTTIRRIGQNTLQPQPRKGSLQQNIISASQQNSQKKLTDSVNQKPRIVARSTAKVAKRRWSPEDDDKLLAGHKRYGSRWTLISNECFDGNFNCSACFSRYMNVLHPNRKTGPWLREEKDKLNYGVSQYGFQWTKISRQLFNFTRAPNDCRVEYLEVLNPDLKRGPWSDEECQNLLTLHHKGYNWVQCADQLNRPPNWTRQKGLQLLRDQNLQTYELRNNL